jgi:hypothetical protein
VQGNAVAFLVLGALGATAAVLWPFVPALLTLVPLGLVLALGSWYLVVVRLRNSGVEEFLDAVAGEPREVGPE